MSSEAPLETRQYVRGVAPPRWAQRLLPALRAGELS
jgi:hypothetical protein